MKYTQVLFLCAPYLHKSSDNLIESLILVSNSPSVFFFSKISNRFFPCTWAVFSIFLKWYLHDWYFCIAANHRNFSNLYILFSWRCLSCILVSSRCILICITYHARNTIHVIEINETNLVVSKDTVLANQKLSIAWGLYLLDWSVDIIRNMEAKIRAWLLQLQLSETRIARFVSSIFDSGAVMRKKAKGRGKNGRKIWRAS